MKLAVTIGLCTWLLLLASGCTTYKPKVSKYQPYVSEDCQLVTRKFRLDRWKLNGDDRALKQLCTDTADCAAFMIGSGLWTVGSLVVSGSITVSANALHWMEYQGRCDAEDIVEPILPRNALIIPKQSTSSE